jgi:hypothetical protein
MTGRVSENGDRFLLSLRIHLVSEAGNEPEIRTGLTAQVTFRHPGMARLVSGKHAGRFRSPKPKFSQTDCRTTQGGG